MPYYQFVSDFSPKHISDRLPQVSGAQMVAQLAPPQQFAHASFASYKPDPKHPSQQQASSLLQGFVQGGLSGRSAKKTGGFFGLRKKNTPEQMPADTALQVPVGKQGIYLDGGFGVGKTHLLAAAWHAQPGRKYFGTFIEYTALAGALGYEGAVQQLSGAKLICIDEFELDDPGDTMLITRLIKDLTAGGTKFIATSNTPPNALGEGRFAAADFMREIQAMAERFVTVRIDGEDYRQRDIAGEAKAWSTQELVSQLREQAVAGKNLTLDSFTQLLEHLKQVHPASYAYLLDGIDYIGISDAYELADQAAALRFVAFIDRVYDAQIPIFASGTALNRIFSEQMLAGGYQKKYLRCMSRANALCAAVPES